MTLRQLLARRLKVTPTTAAELVRAGGVYVGQVRMGVPTLRVAEGERVTVYRTAAAVRPVEPSALRVVHRDEACVIVDKPHGVPASATKVAVRGTVATALVQLLMQERVARPYVGLVHALPVAAAGLAVFTVRGQTTESFFKEFAELAMERRYVVRVTGELAASRSCDARVVQPPSGTWRLARGTEGIDATTTVTRVAVLDDETLAEVTLLGGGTAGGEAVRLHMAALGLTLVGDVDHGREGAPMLCLLASRVAFTHPRSGLAVAADAELPAWAIVGEDGRDRGPRGSGEDLPPS